MNYLVSGLFFDSDAAGAAISHLKEKGYTKEISVISKDWNDPEVRAADIKKDVGSGAAVGAGTGAAVAGSAARLAAAMLGAVTVPIPGIGLIAAGPIAATLGGAAAGAATGGLIGALLSAGLPEEKARAYENQIEAGDTLVSVTVPEERSGDVSSILSQHGATGIETLKV